MKNKISIISGMFVAIALMAITLSIQHVNANLSRVEVTKGGLAEYNSLTNPYAIASTSQTYVVAGVATTTWIVPIESADAADLNLYVIASSTSSIVQLQLDYSDDTMCTVPAGGFTLISASACNWYREDINSTSGAVVTEANNPIRLWTPASVATSTHTVRLGVNGIVSYRYVRVGLAAGTANYSVWAHVGKKVQIQGAQ